MTTTNSTMSTKTLPEQFARAYRRRTNGNSTRETQLKRDLWAFIAYVRLNETWDPDYQHGTKERYTWRSIAMNMKKDALGRNSMISAWIVYQRETMKAPANAISRRLTTLRMFYGWLHEEHPNELPYYNI